MKRITVAIPPLLAGDSFIDNPAFAFLPPLLWAAAARAQANVNVVNAFLDFGHPVQTKAGLLIGPEPEIFWRTVAEIPADDLVIAWSSYHRRADPKAIGLQAGTHDLIASLARANIATWITDFWHAECRCEPVPAPDASVLGSKRSWATDGTSEITKALGLSTTSGDAALDSSAIHAQALERLAGCNSVVRTGASPGAQQTYPQEHPWRRDGHFWPIFGSFGCSYRCLFCRKDGDPSHWRARPIATIEREISAIAQAGGKLLFVLDPIANYEHSHFVSLLGLVGQASMRAVFPNGLSVSHLNDEQITALARVASDLVVSIETPVPRLQATLHKRIDLAHAEQMLARAGAAGLNLSAHFITSIPGETAEETRETVNYANSLHERLGVATSIQNYTAIDQVSAGELVSSIAVRSHAASGPSGEIDARSILTNEQSEVWKSARRKAMQSPKVIVNVGYVCNNHCVFCAVGDRPRVDGMIGEQVDFLSRAAADGIHAADIDGGEPTLYPHLPTLLRHAVKLGFERITITTNGRLLSYPKFAHKLAQVPGLSLCISLHGSSAAAHEQLTRAPGSFEQTVAGIANASKANLTVTLNVTAVAQNASDIFDTIALGIHQGATAANVQRYTPFGAGEQDLSPPIALVREQVLLAQQRYPSFPIRLVNFTPCEAGPLITIAADDEAKAVRTMQFGDLREVALAEWLKPARHHSADCRSCVLGADCAGYWDRSVAQAPASDEMAEFVFGLGCTVGCRFCAVPCGAEPDLSTEQALKLIAMIAPRNPRFVRISGGECTERTDLEILIGEVRRLIPRAEISIQSCGIALADRSRVRALIDAGTDAIRLSIWAHDNDSYSRLTRVDGGFTKFSKALENAVALCPKAVEIDYLGVSQFLGELPATVMHFASMGALRARLWFPGHDGRASTPGGVDCIPRLSEAMQPFQRALALEQQVSGLAVDTIFAPKCILGPWAEHTFDVHRARVLLVQGSRVMSLGQASIDRRTWAPVCTGCAARDGCFGVRQSYLDRWGDSELKPIK